MLKTGAILCSLALALAGAFTGVAATGTDVAVINPATGAPESFLESPTFTPST